LKIEFFSTVEVTHCFKKPVEPASTIQSESWSLVNNSAPMPAAVMPKMGPSLLTRPTTDMNELEQFQRAEEETTKMAQPTMSHQMEQNARVVNSQRMPGWTLSNERPESYQQVSAVNNNNNMALPQGSYYGKCACKHNQP
jgi:hypothetical protein